MSRLVIFSVRDEQSEHVPESTALELWEMGLSLEVDVYMIDMVFVLIGMALCRGYHAVCGMESIEVESSLAFARGRVLGLSVFIHVSNFVG